MVNDHVKDAQYGTRDSHQQGYDSDDEFLYGLSETMPINDWETYYSEDLYNMWSAIKSYGDQTGARVYCMEFADYTNFVEYCYAQSSKRMCPSKVGP